MDQRFDELSADDGKVVVASLVSNNDFGKAYDVAFKAYVDQSEHAEDIEYVSETIEPTAPTVTDPMTTLKSKDPDVFIAMVFSSFCTQAVIEAAQNGMHDTADYLFQPSVCPGNTYVKADAVGGDGAASDGGGRSTPAARTSTTPARPPIRTSPGPARCSRSTASTPARRARSVPASTSPGRGCRRCRSPASWRVGSPAPT
ncbi:MAG: hypothetical protein R2749_13445 [Acidimicrobiales bacterium]